MYGQAELCFTRKMKKGVLVRSEENDEVVYQFRLRKRKGDGTESWSCSDCEGEKGRTGCVQPIPCIDLIR